MDIQRQSQASEIYHSFIEDIHSVLGRFKTGYGTSEGYNKASVFLSQLYGAGGGVYVYSRPDFCECSQVWLDKNGGKAVEELIEVAKISGMKELIPVLSNLKTALSKSDLIH